MNEYFSFYSIEGVYSIIIRLFSIGLIISSLEYIACLKEYSSKGIFAWKILKLTPFFEKQFISPVANLLFDSKGVAIVSYIRLLASSILFLFPFTFLTIIFIGIIALTSLLLSIRNLVGNDGSDQMNTVLCLTAFIYFATFTETIGKVGLFFIAAQSILSYFVAGIAKLIAPKWRNGLAIYEIMNTESYGNNRIAKFLKRKPVVTRILNWKVITVECLFPLVLLVPFPYLVVFLIWGFFFHLYNAVMMGLNGFFWAFISSYPAIVFTNWYLHANHI